MIHSLENLIDQFNKLPGIGKKTATRLAFAILDMEIKEVEIFSNSLILAKKNIKKCSTCGNFSEDDICDICQNQKRDHSIICVVEDSKDIIAMERAKNYNGVYHVLHGKISPLNGINIDNLNIKKLIERVAKNDIKEVILALNPDLEGETTAMYINKLLKNFDITISKIASGIPMGGNIEYSDIATLSKALEGRIKI
ncbi:DNA replication and repair protein RecR [Hypnocyclicus thermotrophus]|uniref:Recombination protein RecR n=1 Tax=Hypnocyclicus thermotrophus TaxID=1627895 RepID=A0AA46DYI4_9FUSO|nr:recombination mediator RecR [Hypnocyclicus thermotrophus]TDT70471.1 DNA replication and repair protein RecR [Hypnocyclicus thermotrophus]